MKNSQFSKDISIDIFRDDKSKNRWKKLSCVAHIFDYNEFIQYNKVDKKTFYEVIDGFKSVPLMWGHKLPILGFISQTWVENGSAFAEFTVYSEESINNAYPGEQKLGTEIHKKLNSEDIFCSICFQCVFDKQANIFSNFKSIEISLTTRPRAKVSKIQKIEYFSLKG